MAISRILIRPKPNFRNTPRGRPVIAQRRRCLTGAALRGIDWNLSRASKRSSSVASALLITAKIAARFAAYFLASATRFT